MVPDVTSCTCSSSARPTSRGRPTWSSSPAHRVGDGKVRFSSAGVHAQDDTLIDPAMAIELTSRGIGSDDFRSRRLTGAVLAGADLVLTAEAAHRARILDEHPVATRKVLTFGQADQALARVDLGIAPSDVPAALVAARRGASASLDVVDPYRRGPEAARVAALEIDGLVERLLAPGWSGSTS